MGSCREMMGGPLGQRALPSDGGGAAVAERGMSGVLADGLAVAPAALALGGGGLGDGGDVRFAGCETEFAQDEELFQLGEAGAEAIEFGGIGQLERDGGFEVVGDDFFGAGFLEGLGNKGAELQEAVAFR